MGRLNMAFNPLSSGLFAGNLQIQCYYLRIFTVEEMQHTCNAMEEKVNISKSTNLFKLIRNALISARKNELCKHPVVLAQQSMEKYMRNVCIGVHVKKLRGFNLGSNKQHYLYKSSPKNISQFARIPWTVIWKTRHLCLGGPGYTFCDIIEEHFTRILFKATLISSLLLIALAAAEVA